MIRKFSIIPFEVLLYVREGEICIHIHHYSKPLDRNIQRNFCKYCTKSYLWNTVHITRRIQTPEQLREEIDYWNMITEDD